MADFDAFRGFLDEERSRDNARTARRQRYRREALTILREALPNALGTIVGGLVLALFAVIVGVLDDVPVWTILGGLASTIVGGFICYVLVASALPPNTPEARAWDRLRAARQTDD